MSRAEQFAQMLIANGQAITLTRSEKDGQYEIYAWYGGSVKLILSTFNRGDCDEVIALCL